MVKDTGKTLYTGTFKPVNAPEAVEVYESPTGLPVALKTKSKQAIVSIDGKWRIDDEWWRAEPLSRMYYAVILSSGRRVVIYKDITQRRWYRQSY